MVFPELRADRPYHQHGDDSIPLRPTNRSCGHRRDHPWITALRCRGARNWDRSPAPSQESLQPL